VSLPRRLRGFAYQTFYSMPGPIRQAVARLVAPSYLVGAVAVIHDAEASGAGRLLLLRQATKQSWSLPAGLLKKREAPADGAARELFEETGVRISPADLTAGQPNALIHHTMGVVDTVWFGSVPASTATLRVDGGEILEAGWFALDDLPRLTVNTAALLGRYGIGPRATQQS
jgi:8-oxo-dGTP diphosphatase